MRQAISHAGGSRVRRCVALLFLVATSGTQGATFLVGTGAGCNFNNIQSGINAAASNPGPDIVRISNATTWGQGGVSIGQQDVTLDGRFASCTDTAVNGNYAQIVGDATNPDARPAMVTVTGGGVRRLLGLQIRNNVRGVNSAGGAISYSGSGELILSDVDLRDNRADFGGAIATNGGVLTLASRVLIENNIADRIGGGIRISGGAILYAVGPDLSIASNEAYDTGGGLAVIEEASAYIASAGFGSRAILQSNRAGISFDNGDTNGGAIAIASPTGARVVVFSTSAASPTRIADNRAREKGGAVYLQYSSPTQFATLCVMDTHLIGNSAEAGVAVFADNNAGINTSVVYNIPTRSECAVPATAPAQPVRCSRAATGCNVIEGHIAQSVSGTLSGGGVVTASNNIELRLRNATFVDNTAGFLINANGAALLELNTSLMASNVLSGSAVRAGLAVSNLGFVMRNVTIADNALVGSTNPSVFIDNVAPTSLSFNNNLIFQPGRVALFIAFGPGFAAHDWRYNATNTPQVVPGPFQLALSGAPFENPAFNDFRLRIGSDAVNAFAAGSAVDAPMDLDGRPRPVNPSILAPDDSDDDVGAFERQEADPWLPNGAFSASAQLRYWEPSANGEAVPGVAWDTQDAQGDPGSGSALVNLPLSLASRMTVLRRCFDVPQPGRYTITAKARRATGLNADNALLSWRFRRNDANCSSTNVQENGEVAFVAGTGFQPLSAPLELLLLDLTANSTIEIRLDVISGLNLNGLTDVRFDDVSITGAQFGLDNIFANGFE